MPMHPIEITLDRDRRRLSVTWDNGATDVFPAAVLRDSARDAGSVRLAVDNWAVPAASSLTIINIEPIGNYAVRLAFSDGHDRGIFPWAYLSELAAAGTPISAVN